MQWVIVLWLPQTCHRGRKHAHVLPGAPESVRKIIRTRDPETRKCSHLRKPIFDRHGWNLPAIPTRRRRGPPQMEKSTKVPTIATRRSLVPDAIGDSGASALGPSPMSELAIRLCACGQLTHGFHQDPIAVLGPQNSQLATRNSQLTTHARWPQQKIRAGLFTRHDSAPGRNGQACSSGGCP